jgi:hypothetical protein
MPQTYAQTHAQNRHHAGRNPREHGAPLREQEAEQEKAVESGVQSSPAGETGGTQESGMTRGGGAQRTAPEHAVPDAASPTAAAGQSAQAGGADTADAAKKIRHPEPAEHNDSDKSKLPERGDADRKQAPNDRPGKKSGEGEAPVG